MFGCYSVVRPRAIRRLSGHPSAHGRVLPGAAAGLPEGPERRAPVRQVWSYHARTHRKSGSGVHPATVGAAEVRTGVRAM